MLALWQHGEQQKHGICFVKDFCPIERSCQSFSRAFELVVCMQIGMLFIGNQVTAIQHMYAQWVKQRSLYLQGREINHA